MKFWIEVLPSGRIEQASMSSVQPSSTVGEVVEVDCLYDPREVAFFDGVVVDIGVAPSINHVFDYEARQWIDPRSLADFKTIQWAEIKARRTELEFGEFEYNGMVFDGDLDAQRRLTSYISVSKSAIAASIPFSAEFILANNSVVTLTAEDFVGIEMAKVSQVAAAFATATAYRDQIEAAVSIEEVQAIVWE